MKKLRYVVLIFCVMMTLTLSGCSGCCINDRASTNFCLPVDDGEYYVYTLAPFTLSDYALKIDKTTGEATLDKSGWDEVVYDLLYPVVAVGNDFPRYSPEFAQGYEGLEEILTEKYETGKAKLIQYLAVEYDAENKIAYGFCNAYSSASGFLSGGGNIDAAKIVGSAFFSYDCNAGSLNEICYLEKCNIVAFGSEKVIYFKNEKYYAYDCASEAETFICNDEAYDKGFTNYSYVRFMFNDDLCIILMTRRYLQDKKDYIKAVVCNYEGEIILEESWGYWDFLDEQDN